MAANETPVMTDSTKILIVLSIALIAWLLYQLLAVLMPFFIAALLAYLGDPLVDYLEEKKLSRTLSVTLVFSVLLIFGLLILLIFLPMLSTQVGSLIKRLPEYVSTIQLAIRPGLASIGLPEDLLDVSTIKEALSKYRTEVGQVAGGVFSYMTRSGAFILQWLTNLVLVPVVTFYLLRDWDLVVARFRGLLPRRYSEQVIKLSLECDEMLAAFLRGQLMVMFALAIIYTISLAFIGLELALLLGVIAGLLSFVPYLGLIVGIVLAGLAAHLQFSEWLPVLMVAGVFSVAQMIEGIVLTPRFVGERIGLHPVAVIFAILAGGQLFGFTGVLLALPVAAVIMVLLRHAYQQYLDSHLYS